MARCAACNLEGGVAVGEAVKRFFWGMADDVVSRETRLGAVVMFRAYALWVVMVLGMVLAVVGAAMDMLAKAVR